METGSVSYIGLTELFKMLGTEAPKCSLITSSDKISEWKDAYPLK